ncbi:MAG TPA: imelysin family protein, partial [Candidatus Binatia bacterium]|nr:imelysin family protein [Candidatus Binatia bacterium]
MTFPSLRCWRDPERSAASGALIVLGAALAIGCGGDDGAVSSERHAMLAQIGADVVLPTYRELSTAAADLAFSASAFGASPTAETLDETRSAWRHARAAWRRGRAFEFGPAERMRTFAKIDFAPIRADRIEQEIADTAELTPEHVAALGANVKGFIAIEYLLFDPDGDDDAVLASFSGGDGRRAAYLAAL